MNARKFDGLVASARTPLDDRDAVDSRLIGQIEHLLDIGINRWYVCGTTLTAIIVHQQPLDLVGFFVSSRSTTKVSSS